ncbi:MAG: tripartite tricarboxylate transporter substrate binding protein [Pseudomonadota bacterium]
MIWHRRAVHMGAIVFTGLSMLAAPALAQRVAADYPNKALRVIVNYTPGGPTDLTARTLALKMSELLGQQVIVDNRPSSSGVIGSQTVARAAPDGYTLMLSTSGHTSTIAATQGDKLPFDPFRDFTPISLVVKQTQMMIAHPSLGAKTVADVVRIAKAKPGELNYGSVGIGNTGHLALELLCRLADIKMVHVPYKGTAPALTDLMSGRVQLMLNSMPTVLPYVKSGKLVALSVGTLKRNPAAPDVPTMIESGFPGWEVLTWYGMFGPAKMPMPLVSRLNSVINRAISDPATSKSLSSQGAEPAGSTPEALAKLMRDEYERWTRLIREANILLE